MKAKIKTKLIWRVLKIIWFIIGGFILLWAIFFFIKMHTIGGLGVLAGALLFAAGIYMLMIYFIITFLFILIRWIIKKLRKKK
ncbi:hypothetical protein ES703_66330 [subsurface metagenome]